MCTDTPQKEENSCRIASIVNRLEKQNSGIKEEISTLHDRDTVLRTKIQEMIDTANTEPLLTAAKLGNLQIAKLELENKVRFIFSCYEFFLILCLF